MYASIPYCATLLREDSVAVKPELVTSIPAPSVRGEATAATSPTSIQPPSPSKQSFNISNLLLSSTLQLPNPPPASPRDGARLLSTREALSLQATTVNFRRFVSKSGPIFWLQDRIEEILMWKKGGKVTCTWMAIYSFLCFFPGLFLLVPHVVLVSVILATHEDRDVPEMSSSMKSASSPVQQPKEGTVDWYANLQAIQNLMGAVSDLYDSALPYVPILTWTTPYTSHLLTFLCVSLMFLAPIAIFLPLRPTLLFLGIAPLLITHPLSLRILPAMFNRSLPTLQSRAQALVDNDNLTKQHWFSDKHSIELWESERWSMNCGWSKLALRLGEYKPWTSGRDGWCDIISQSDDVKSLSMVLSPGYKFVETEDWRLDQEGKGFPLGVDDRGWSYTNDSWQHPYPAPLEEWKAQGMTRRRRWLRRIYRL
ncbi:hypothetical protein K439DRAFT_1653004 [Ramaria rubella]|nr:hypothetical protein K439DRAFT_1653004 [Ramaria rubella]